MPRRARSPGSAAPRWGDAADEPLGEHRPRSLASRAPSRFIATQEGSEEPVAYDPCRPIHVVVNGGAPPVPGVRRHGGVRPRDRRATGLQFVYDGTTDEAPSEDRSPYQPERYGERWAPLLISWSDPTETPELEGDTVGLGGSSYVTVDRGSVYVTGTIELDGPELADIALGPEGLPGARSVIEHELGHVLGLDHVEDPSQLMNPTTGSVTTFADGDLTGLYRLGRGECFPKV